MGRKQAYKEKKKTTLHVKTSKGNYRWTKGNASAANPAISKFRDAAKNRWKQTDDLSKKTGKSADLLKLHNVITATDLEDAEFNASSVIDDPLANVFKSMGMKDDIASFKSNISGISDCTNSTFLKVQRAFEQNNSNHKHAYALFSAITDNIREKGGDENNNTAYFASLAAALDSYLTEADSKSDNAEELQLLAGVVYLMNMTVPHIPEAVLQSHGASVITNMIKVINLLDSCPGLGNSITIRGLNALAIMVRPQTALNEPALQLLLNFAFKKQPKLRHAAANGLWQTVSNARALETGKPHPFAAVCVVKAEKLLQEFGVSKQSLPAFAVLKAVFARLTEGDMKRVLEIILRFITDNNADVHVKHHCLAQTYNIFKHPAPTNVPSELHALFLVSLTSDKNVPNVDDQQMISAWLALTVEVFCALYQNDQTAAMTHVTTVVKGCMAAMVSRNPQVSKFGSETIRLNIMHKCLFANPPKELDHLLSLFRIISESLSYQFSHIWGQSLTILGKFFQLLQVLDQPIGDKLWSIVQETLPRLEAFRKSQDFVFTFELDRCFEKCMASVGPQAFLAVFPLGITATTDFKNDASLERSWVLPMLKKSMFRNVHLSFFFKNFLPLSIELHKRIDRETSPNVKSLIRTLFNQIWELLPVFAKRSPVNPNEFSKFNASDLFQILERDTLISQWKPICTTLTALAATNEQYMKFFAPRYVKKLFNIFMKISNDQLKALTNVNRGDLDKTILDCIEKLSSLLTDAEKVENFQECLKLAQTPDIELKIRLCDIIVRLTGLLPTASKGQTYDTLISVWMSDTSIDAKINKKAYRALEEMVKSDTDFSAQYESKIIQEFSKNLASCGIAAKKPRLKIVNELLKTTKDVTVFYVFLPELVMSYSETNKVAREEAKNAVKAMANNEAVNREELLEKVMLGFEGDVTLMAKTLQVLSDLVGLWRKDLEQKLVNIVLQKSRILLENAQAKEILKSCVNNVHLMLNVLPKDQYICHVKPILTAMSSWKDTITGNLRVEIKGYLKKLVKAFGIDEILSITPPETNIHRMLTNVRKTNKTLDNKRARGVAAGGEGSDDEMDGEQRRGDTMGEILEDSDDESESGGMEDDSGIMGKNKRGFRASKAVIREDADEVIDFSGKSAAQHVLTKRPVSKTLKQFKPDQFVREEEGRVIVSMQKQDQQLGVMVNSDEDASDIDELDHFNNSDDEPAYTPGGGGIHRDLSGKQKKNQSKKEKEIDVGKSFKGKKGSKHDVRKAGGPEPYAYIKLNPAVSNPRLKKKLRGKFKSQVGELHKGSQKGGKSQYKRAQKARK